MANFAINPRPHLPPGFTWAPRVLPYVPPSLPRACIALNLERTNEDLAIALLSPPVSKDDYVPMARSLHQLLVDDGVHAPEIQPCPIGYAYVRFTSALERERYLHGPLLHLG